MDEGTVEPRTDRARWAFEGLGDLGIRESDVELQDDRGALVERQTVEKIIEKEKPDAILPTVGGQTRFHTRYDLLLSPTMPVTAIPAGIDFPAGQGMTDWTDWSPFTYPFNMTGQAALSVPCGFDSGGLPIGLQMVAARFRDDIVLRDAAAYQTAHPEAFPDAPVVRSA